MKAFTYYSPTEIIFGQGKLDETAKVAKRFGTKALLVTGKGTSAMEAAGRVLELLRDAGVETAHYDGVEPNPTTVQVTQGAKMAKELGAEVIIGLGGGSAMDTAKAIAVEAVHPGTVWDYNCHTQRRPYR